MSSKNILCLSWCDADEVMNYGQILQGLAMMRILRDLTDGTIRYVSYQPRGFKGMVRYYLHHYNPIDGHAAAYINTKKIIRYFIKEFNVEFYQVSDYKRLNELSCNMELMMCGSDQIWHPLNYDKGYFLDFGESNIRKISYAASLPKTQWESMYTEKYALIGALLRKFDAIAVRERSSVDFIKKLSHSDDVIDVLDPTFLVDRSYWKKIVEPIEVADKYIFVYIPNGMDEKLAEMVNTIKEKSHIKNMCVLMTRGHNFFSNANIMKFVSIGEFLYLISHATCVVTSSFHAVVFSSIFHTDFYAYDVPNAKRGEDCRLSDVLSLMGLEDRNIGKCEFDDFKNINFDNVENRLLVRRMKSVEFLNNQLKN